MLHALPGLGADHRLYSAPWSQLPEFRSHDWPRYAGETSLAAMAESLCTTAVIHDGDSLIGTSLGGMVACEIAKLRRIQTLFLVSSTTESAGVNPLLARVHPAARRFPFRVFQILARALPGELPDMFAHTDTDFLRAMCRAIFEWPGLAPTSTSTSTRIIRIHGGSDWIIPPPARADLLLKGGHLIVRHQATACAEFVQGHLG